MRNNKNNSIYKAGLRKPGPNEISGSPPVYGIPGYSYYFLALAIAITVFFLVWAALLDSGEMTPFIPAGVIAGFVLIAAFFLREFVIRRSRRRQFEYSRRLDLNLEKIAPRRVEQPAKLTVQQNQMMLASIGEKSNAARALKSVPDAHWEAFELCENYLQVTRKEIARTHVNSPRFSPINKGRGKIKKLHHYHLLKWAEVKSGRLTTDTMDPAVTFETKLAKAKAALENLNTALRFYPRDKKLIESQEAVSEYVATVAISNKTDLAIRAQKQGQKQEALKHYDQALTDLEKADLRKREKELIERRIVREMEKIRRS